MKFPIKKTSVRKKKAAALLPDDQLKEFRKAEKEKEEAQKLKFCAWLLKEHGLKCTPEYRFHPKRRWRIDYFFEGKVRVSLECEGGVFVKGRHTSPQGFILDMEKYNMCTEFGIYLLRCQPKDLKIWDYYIEPELLRQLKAVL